MTKDFAQGFVGLSGERLASEIPAELRFDHREGRFDIRASVIVIMKLALIHLVVVEHSMPYIYLAGRLGILAKVDIRLCALILNYGQVGFVAVCLIC